MEPNVEAAKCGNREAMARIVDEHYDAVYRFCVQRVGPDQAADTAQETFLTAQKQVKNFEGRSTLKTWLFGIALNHCRNASRQRTFVQFDAAMDRQSPHPESNLINQEALRDALNSLSDEHREVVILHEIDGLTYEEAAEVIGIPIGTVKSRLHHAFVALRKSLAPTPAVNS